MVGPTLATDGVAPRIPKLQAAPNTRAGGGGVHTADVVKLQTKLAASLLPNSSTTPVVIVAVKVALGARLLVGVKVAIFVALT
jgi:hypothetical protein